MCGTWFGGISKISLFESIMSKRVILHLHGITPVTINPATIEVSQFHSFMAKKLLLNYCLHMSTAETHTNFFEAAICLLNTIQEETPSENKNASAEAD